MNYKTYLEYVEFKSEIIKFLVSNIFYNYKKQIDDGDLVFVGSIIHNKLGIQHKKYFNDIDISVNDNTIGNEIIENFNVFLNQLNLTNYENYYKRNFELVFKNANFNNLLAVDFFLNVHPVNYCTQIEIFPSIYTKHFGHEWNLDKIYNTYQTILFIKDDNVRIKKIGKIKTLFNDYLKVITESEFQNKELYNNIIKLINE
jgi:hypothetical protein